MLETINKLKNSKYIFVVGIGGSDLASKAVWNAMTLHKIEENKPTSSVGKRMFFLESPDSREYEEVENFVKNEIASLEEIVLIVISKSGKTEETLQTFNKTFEILSEKFGLPINERILVISTPKSVLWKIAEDKKFEKIEWEGETGGRFSAFTVAHTTVISIAGLNSDAFLTGKKEAESLAKNLAERVFNQYKNGCDILDFFIFNSELEDLGKWRRQLIAESLAVITPTVSMGPVDLHSMLELYLGGPKNRFTIFVRSLKEIDKSVNESAYENVTKAYKDAGLSFEKIEMPEINEYEIGKFMATMISVTLELAKLFDVNPYDQPAVEKYKENIRK